MLEGEKVILRPLENEDINSFYLWRNDKEIKVLSLMHPFPVTLESEKKWFEKTAISNVNNNIFFSIISKRSNKLAGYIKLYNISWIHRHCYLGIIIGEKSEQGKGIGEESIKLINDYAFNYLNLFKITLEVASYNQKAIQLYNKLGFLKEGELIKHVCIQGVWHNVIIMSLFNKTIFG